MVSAPAPVIVIRIFVCSRAGCTVGCGFDVRTAPVADAGAIAGAGPAELRREGC
jgi:hypothetical protein